MRAIPPLGIEIRSYGRGHGAHRHEFAQLVLPLRGSLSIDIAGREGRIAPGQAAFIDVHSLHSQESEVANRSLVVDLAGNLLEADVGEPLVSRPFLPLTPAADKLVGYMSCLTGDGKSPSSAAGLWVPLLLDALAATTPRPRSRLSALLATIEAAPGLAWTTEMMASRAAVSVSHLHALFRAELDTTPRAWLAELRLKKVTGWLAWSDRPIAELAYRAGYADQSALTRAMRKATGLTPAAYRRRHAESRPKTP